MAADNTELFAGSGGETLPSLGDAGGLNWPVGCSAYPTTTSPGANILQLVDLTHGLPVQQETGATFAVTGTFWQATQPISATSLPLPTGAATESTLNSIGSVLVSGIGLPSGASTSAAQSTSNTSLASIDGKITACNTGAVVIASGSVTVSGTVTANAGTGTFAVSAASLPLPTGAATEATLSTLNGKVTACNTGAVVISSGTVAVTQTTSPWVVSLTSTTITGTVAVTQSGSWTNTVTQATASSLNATVVGTGTFLVQAAQSGTWNIGTITTLTQWNAGHGTAAAALRVELPTDGTGVVGLNAGSQIVGKVGIDQTTPGTTNAVQEIAGTAGGLLVSRNFPTTGVVIATNVKGSAGQTYGISGSNINATPVWIRLYNNTNNPPTTGDTPFWSCVLPGNTAGILLLKSWPQGLAMGTGIGIRVTGLIADNDATVLTANTVQVMVEYK